MNYFLDIIQLVEVGRAQFITRFVPLVMGLVIVLGSYDFLIYRGLNDAQSMDNAQLARQIVRGQGFTTKFLRPIAINQLRDFATKHGSPGSSGDLFPEDRFPPASPRVLPDTYNAPGYPYLLAGYFFLIHPEFEQTATAMRDSRGYSADRWIPFLNQAFLLLTAGLVFILGYRLFDGRVAWLALLAFLGTDLVWKYSITGMSTIFLMFLVTSLLMCVLEIYDITRESYEDVDRPFLPALLWALATGIILALAGLTRLHLLALLAPLFILSLTLYRGRMLIFAIITLVVAGALVPWFLHVNAVSGSPFGSNFPLLLYGQDQYEGNQVFCQGSIPAYELYLREAGRKEASGFLWNFQQAWGLLGTNPFVLFFAASLLHQFRRVRTQVFHWMIYGCALVLVAVNNLGSAHPNEFDSWNIIIILLPCMLVIGAAYFFIILDRLDLRVGLLKSLIVITSLVLTAFPLAWTLLNGNQAPNVYYPALIKNLGQLVHPDEWITTDMPWAAAWYGDRASLWLPDSVTEFEKLHDHTCPTGMLIISPATWGQPISTYSSGEYKEWSSLILSQTAPPDFPLPTQTSALTYHLWSDRARWQTQ